MGEHDLRCYVSLEGVFVAFFPISRETLALLFRQRKDHTQTTTTRAYIYYSEHISDHRLEQSGHEGNMPWKGKWRSVSGQRRQRGGVLRSGEQVIFLLRHAGVAVCQVKRELYPRSES